MVDAIEGIHGAENRSQNRSYGDRTSEYQVHDAFTATLYKKLEMSSADQSKLLKMAHETHKENEERLKESTGYLKNS